MPRRLRVAPANYVYHVLNRAVGRNTLFDEEGDYRAFLDVLQQAQERSTMRLLAYVVMPNHWHLLLWPREDGALSDYVRWLSVTHTRRWHAAHRSVGTGPLYQGRFKSFPIEEDDHLWTVWRYIERNPLRAGLTERAELWPWSSLAARRQRTPPEWLTEGPVPLPAGWVQTVNRPQTEAEEAALRRSVQRGTPFGRPTWQEQTAGALGLQSSLRPRGRPRRAGVGVLVGGEQVNAT